jgi:hypothetical protein
MLLEFFMSVLKLFECHPRSLQHHCQWYFAKFVVCELLNFFLLFFNFWATDRVRIFRLFLQVQNPHSLSLSVSAGQVQVLRHRRRALVPALEGREEARREPHVRHLPEGGQLHDSKHRCRRRRAGTYMNRFSFTQQSA